ncbi:MAG: hypothetical protein IGR92_09090 [Leptolyngbyaceae cyanobacterium T60_A2020_046]|nr:hypothetical protein [Leptolyngbyaceae cyanobacterium T60_A2020_046]
MNRTTMSQDIAIAEFICGVADSQDEFSTLWEAANRLHPKPCSLGRRA